MIKRLNFTERHRIPAKQVNIEVFDGEPNLFGRVKLTEKLFPPHAAVFLEAMCARSSVVERIDCGRFGALDRIEQHLLRQVEGENIFFTLKVVDQSERFGRILGIGEIIYPIRSGKPANAGRRGILPIEPVDLDEELWRLEFREHDVYLLMNPALVEPPQTDPLFYAAVYPAVVRNVLRRAIDENADAEEESGRWPVLWLRFGKNLLPSKIAPPKADDSREDKDEWIDDVVAAFCKSHSMKSNYFAALAASNGADQ